MREYNVFPAMNDSKGIYLVKDNETGVVIKAFGKFEDANVFMGLNPDKSFNLMSCAFIK